MNLKQHLILMRDKRDLFRKRPILTIDNISYANWWMDNPEQIWFTGFIRHHFPDAVDQIRFYSVFGPRKALDDGFRGIRIFYTGENVEPRVRYDKLEEREEKAAGWNARMEAFSDYCADQVDLALGFGTHPEIHNYLRFPFWLIRHFQPGDDPELIQQRLTAIDQAWRQTDCHTRRDAVVIASHDFFGTRKFISDGLCGHVNIEYDGKWRNNSNRLWNEFANNKDLLMQNFRFNICPENMDADGYVTEKIFDAYAAGTIPIYHGSKGHPEQEIVSDDTYINWNYDNDNAGNLNLIDQLCRDEDFYEAFLGRPRFRKDAAEHIYQNYYVALHHKLAQVLS
jgi:hypothetical protein